MILAHNSYGSTITTMYYSTMYAVAADRASSSTMHYTIRISTIILV